MRIIIKSLVLVFTLFLSSISYGDEAEEMKKKLIGKVMGGREKCWRFQSLSQIKELKIQEKKEIEGKEIYSISLVLQDPRVSGTYKAEADVTYGAVGGKWEVQIVGLKSFVRIE